MNVDVRLNDHSQIFVDLVYPEFKVRICTDDGVIYVYANYMQLQAFSNLLEMKLRQFRKEKGKP